MKTIFTETVPTAATNGQELLINPTWYGDLNIEEKVGLLLHEGYHVAYQHVLPLFEHLDQDKLNLAQDYYINLQLVTDRFSIPPNGYIDKKYQGMSSLAIYKVLPDPPPNYQRDVQIRSDLTPEQAKIASDNMLIKAVGMSKAAGEDPGNIPGDILRYVEELLNPQLPWDVILRNYMDSYAKDDYSWRKPNKKFPDIYLPSLHSESIDNISVLIDTSGSITNEDLKAFFTEIQAIKDSLNPESLWVGSFDTQLYDSKLFDNFTELKLQGGGGTYSTPIKKYIEENNPNILLVFSDMYMDFSSLNNVDYDHLYWIATDGHLPPVPLGTVIEYHKE